MLKSKHFGLEELHAQLIEQLNYVTHAMSFLHKAIERLTFTNDFNLHSIRDTLWRYTLNFSKENLIPTNVKRCTFLGNFPISPQQKDNINVIISSTHCFNTLENELTWNRPNNLQVWFRWFSFSIWAIFRFNMSIFRGVAPENRPKPKSKGVSSFPINFQGLSLLYGV